MSVWRDPAEESDRLYPGLSLHDGRVAGSIVIDHSRLPLWAVVGELVGGGWPQVLAGWDYIEQDYGFGAAEMGGFLHDLLDLRGEFGRLLLVLADAERREAWRFDGPSWWEVKSTRRRVLAQLRRCVAVLEQEERG